MNLEESLRREHSKSQCINIVAWIGNDRKKFAELMNLFFRGEYRLSQRAAWPMSEVVLRYPNLIQPYLKKLIQLLNDATQHSAVVRNIVRLLQAVEVPKPLHGQLMTACFQFIESNETPVAIKAYALTVLDNLSKLYPEIIPEIQLIVKERLPHETAAFRMRAKPFLREDERER